MKLDTWLQTFLIDYAMYKGKLDEALTFLNQLHEPSLELSKNLKYANIMYLKKSFVVRDYILSLPLKYRGLLDVLRTHSDCDRFISHEQSRKTEQ